MPSRRYKIPIETRAEANAESFKGKIRLWTGRPGENAMIVEVFGPEPPCPRCMRALEIVKQAVKELRLNCEVKKIDAYSKSTIFRYGLVFTPAVAIDGKVFAAGRIPSVDEVKRILRFNYKH
jgi:small redox-active disulfide protein 2